MAHPLFAAHHKLEPFWLDDTPAPTLAAPDPPGSADVAVVGSGYTGLAAALTLAREGRGVVVFDAKAAGYGCSSRNGGQCGGGLKSGFDGLSTRYGKARALAMYREARASLEYLAELVEREHIACHFSRPGRFIGAHRPGHYETLARDFETLRREVGLECHAVPRAEQHGEIGSDIYYGGGVIAGHAALHPALYHRGLLERALDAGAVVVPHTPVTRIERAGAGFAVTHGRGTLAAGNVIVATNGYTNAHAHGRGPALLALRRRVIPIGSYMIATEPLAPGVMERLIPNDRVLSDTRQVVLYYRSSPDRRRLLFGGRVALAETDPGTSGPKLHGIMSAIFPELGQARISHSWMGFVAYTFDHLPHLGVHDGLHFAMGYCGTGVAMASWLGHKVALKVLGAPEGATAFDDLAFPTRPFYRGTPWFLAGAVLYYRLRDQLAR
jgi:glycine/D-amino acid oxidase-like deaminating enzyme